MTEGLSSLEKIVNASEACDETIFFWCDEKGDLFDDTDDGTAEGYLEIHQRRGDDQVTIITLSPKDVKELRLALEADKCPLRLSTCNCETKSAITVAKGPHNPFCAAPNE